MTLIDGCVGDLVGGFTNLGHVPTATPTTQLTLELPIERGDRPRTTIQTLIFDKDRFKSSDAAAKWAKDHGYKASKVDETGESFRLRQRDPSDFTEGSLRTIEITDGVKAVLGHLRNQDIARVKLPPKPVKPPLIRAEDLLNLAMLIPEWESVLMGLSLEGLSAGYDDTAEDLGMVERFDVNEPRAAAFLRGRVGSKITTIAESRLGEVRDVIAGATDRGDTMEELARALRVHFDRGSRTWSTRIARTETAGLYNMASIWSMQDGGIERKEWISARDAIVRESHVEADGQVVAVSEDFILQGGRGPAPGMIDAAEESINCRCAVLPVIDLEEPTAEETAATVSRSKKWARWEERLASAEMSMARGWFQLFKKMGDDALAAIEAGV